jgi:hypothetical protein
MRHIFRRVPLTRYSGTIFARVITGSWGGMKNVGQFTVCDVENVGRLFFDTHSEEWAFSMPMGIKAKLRSPVSSNETWAVCASYRLPGTANRGKVSLHVGRYPNIVQSCSERTLKNLPPLGVQRTQVGAALNQEHFWNGHVRALVVGPQNMSSETWKAIVAIPEGAPNPYDENALAHELGMLKAALSTGEPTLIQRPTEEDLVRMWMR